MNLPNAVPAPAPDGTPESLAARDPLECESSASPEMLERLVHLFRHTCAQQDNRHLFDLMNRFRGQGST
jgi:hypothetical protein